MGSNPDYDSKVRIPISVASLADDVSFAKLVNNFIIFGLRVGSGVQYVSNAR